MKIQSLFIHPHADWTLKDQVFSNQFGISRLQDSWIMLDKLQRHNIYLSISRLFCRFQDKTPATTVVENAAMPFFCEAPEMVLGY